MRPMPVLGFFPYFPEPPVQLDGVGQSAAFLAMDLLHLFPDHLDSCDGAASDLQLLLSPSLQDYFGIHLHTMAFGSTTKVLDKN